MRGKRGEGECGRVGVRGNGSMGEPHEGERRAGERNVGKGRGGERGGGGSARSWSAGEPECECGGSSGSRGGEVWGRGLGGNGVQENPQHFSFSLGPGS